MGGEYLVKLYLSKYSNKTKPSSNFTGIITKTILQGLVDMDIEQLAYEISTKGKTCMLGILPNGAKLKKHTPIISQELIMLDFDNKKENSYSYTDCINDEFMINNACFIYKTFGDYSSKFDKFRVVFKLDEPLTDTFQVEYLYNELFKKYPQADYSCNYPTRLFYGSNKGFKVFNWGNTLKTNDFLNGFNKKSVLLQRKRLEKVYEEQSRQLTITENIPIDVENVENLKNWELLKIGRYDIVKQRLGNKYSKVFASKAQAQLHFKSSIDLKDFLGIDEENMFCDIFHHETNPSANIFISDSNTYLYKCFSESYKFCGDIILVVSRLTGLGTFKSIELIIDLTNSRVDVDSRIARIKSETEMFINILESPDIKDIYPEINKILGRHIPEVVKILQIITDYKYEDINTGEVRLISFLSISSLTKKVSHALHKNISEKRMKRIINLMTLSNIVLKLNEGQIPPYILKTLSEKTYHKNKPNVLEVKGYDDSFMYELQYKCEQLIENDFTLVALSFDFLNRNFGLDEAYRVYPQSDINSLKKIEAKNDKLELEIVNYLLPKLNNQGYVFENELKEDLSKKLYSNSLSDYKWKQLRNDILNKYNLERKRLTKELKEELNLQLSNGKFPTIIIQK